MGCVGPFSEDVESHYADVTAARAAGAIGWDQWIPEIVPDSATDIRELHNIDTNRTWGCFRFGQGEDGSVRRTLAALGARPGRGPVSERPRFFFTELAWWPRSMTSPTIEAYEVFDVLVGIDENDQRVCFHRHR